MLTLNHCLSVKLLKIEHILKLQELKIILYYKFTTNKLLVYLQHLLLDQNSSIHNFKTHGQYNTHTVRVQHEFAKHGLRYTLPHTKNNTPDVLKSKIYTHCLQGFAYSKKYYLQTCCVISTVIYANKNDYVIIPPWTMNQPYPGLKKIMIYKKIGLQIFFFNLTYRHLYRCLYFKTLSNMFYSNVFGYLS